MLDSMFYWISMTIIESYIRGLINRFHVRQMKHFLFLIIGSLWIPTSFRQKDEKNSFKFQMMTWLEGRKKKKEEEEETKQYKCMINLWTHSSLHNYEAVNVVFSFLCIKSSKPMQDKFKLFGKWKVMRVKIQIAFKSQFN